MYCIEQKSEPGFFCIYENPVVRLMKQTKRNQEHRELLARV